MFVIDDSLHILTCFGVMHVLIGHDLVATGEADGTLQAVTHA